VRDLLSYQQQHNRSSAADWQRFSAHRARITRLCAGATGPRLAVLGAGNCNDLELATLAAHFDQIHLVDLDEEALLRARDRQPLDDPSKLVLHAGTDLSGGAIARLLAREQPSVSDQELESWLDEGCAAVVRALPGPFDTVLSSCVLSQLIQSACWLLGSSHPDLEDLGAILALLHLRSMALLLAPGGTLLLVTDTASSKNLEAPFLGTSVGFVQRALARDELLRERLGPASLIEPWLWSLGDQLELLVYALVCRSRA
jgi:hypothetical protein